MKIAMLILAAILSVAEPEHEPAQGYDVPLPAEYIEHVTTVALEYGLDPAWIFGIAYQESRFRPDVTGDSGKAEGMYQIQPRWHQERMQRLGVTNLYDEWQAVYVACDYLSEVLGEYGDIRTALTVYRYGCPTISGEDYAAIVLQKADEIRK